MDDYVSPYDKKNENLYSMNPNMSKEEGRYSHAKRGSIAKSDIYSTPALITPKGYNKLPGSYSGARYDSPRKQSYKEKQNDLKYLMNEEPKRRSSTGYAISDELRSKWKKLGPLTVELIEKHLSDWADVNNLPPDIEYENLTIG